MVGTEQGRWSLLQINLVLLDFFFFINDHFVLFILASVAANRETATESDMLSKTAGVLKYGPEKIGAGVVERW